MSATQDRRWTRSLGLYKPNILEDAEDTDWGERLNENLDLIDDAVVGLRARADAQDATLGAVLQSLAFVRQQNEQLMARLEELHERISTPAPPPAPAPIEIAQPDGRAEIARVGAMLGLPPPEPLSRAEMRAMRAQEAAAPPAEVYNVTTPNFGLNMPEVGGDSGIWGGLLNDNAMTLDGLFLNYLPLSGGRLTGFLDLPGNGAAASPTLTFGTGSSGIYGSGASIAVAAFGSNAMMFSLSANTSYVPLSMNNNRITSVGTPTQDGDAVNRGYLNSTLGNYLPLSGGQLSGALVVPNGAQLAPSLAIGAADDGTGFWRTGNFIVLSLQGQLSAAFTSTLSQFYAPINMLNNKIQTLADATAATDALNLRTGDARYLRLSGGQMSGAIEVLPPQNPQDAASKNYVDTTIAGLSLFMSTWQVAANTPDISGGAPSPGDYYIAVTAVATTPETAPANIPGIGGQVVNNGDVVIWDAVGAVFELVRGGPLTVAEANALYIQKSGDTMAGPLVLAADGTTPMEAVTLQQLQAVAGAEIPEAPVDGLVYGRQGSTTSWQPALPLVGGQIDGPLRIVAPENGPQGYGNNLRMTSANQYPAIMWERPDGGVWQMSSYSTYWNLQMINAAGSATNYISINSGLTYPISFDQGMRIYNGAQVMTGDLQLAQNATAPMQAVTLQQLQASALLYLPLVGGTINPGPLIVSNPSINTTALSAVRVQGVGSGGVGGAARLLLQTGSVSAGKTLVGFWDTIVGTGLGIWKSGTTVGQNQLNFGVINDADGTPGAVLFSVNASNGLVFTGNGQINGTLFLGSPPTLTGHAVNLGYVTTNYLALAGGTMVGSLILAADATAPLQAVTLQQMEAATGAGNYLPISGGELTGSLGVDVALPANRIPSLAMAGNFAVGIFGAFSFNAYYDTVLANWAYYDTSFAATIGQDSSTGTIVIAVMPSGAANAPAVASGYAYLDRWGSFTATGNIISEGDVSAVNTVWANGVASGATVEARGGTFQVVPGYHLQRGGDGWWRFVENGRTTFSITPAGAVYTAEYIECGGMIRSDAGLIVSQGQYQPSLAMSSLQLGQSFGFWIPWGAGGNAIQYGWTDANGSPTAPWGYFDSATMGHNVSMVSYTIDNGNAAMLWGGWTSEAGWVFNIPGAAWKPGGGMWADSSDARIKDVLGDYEQGLDAVLALKPVRYKLKGNWRHMNEDANPHARAGIDGRARINGPHDKCGDTEYIGLIAQEAELSMPEMVSRLPAIIDGEGVDDLRVMDRSALTLALVNAVKEIDARLRAGGL